MADQVNVRSIEALGDLVNGLTRFRSEAEASLIRADYEIKRTMREIESIRRHWQGEAQRRAEDVCRAQEERLLLEAKRRLAHAEAALREVTQWANLIIREADAYAVQARRLSGWLHGDLVKATASLNRRITHLHEYASLGTPGGINLPDGAIDEARGEIERSAEKQAAGIGWKVGDGADTPFDPLGLGDHPEIGRHPDWGHHPDVFGGSRYGPERE